MAYVAPAKDTVCIVGGLGTQADKNQYNGGGATKTAWDAGSPSYFIGTNGGPKSDASAWNGDSNACTVTNSGGYVRITKAGGFTGFTANQIGALAYVSFTLFSSYDNGWYEVINVDTSDGTWIEIQTTYIDDDNCDVKVGGAIDSLQNALDCPLNNAASYNRYIYDNIATETISSTIDVDQWGGSTTTKVFIIGYNSTLTSEAQIIITTDQDLTGGGAGENSLLYFLTQDYFTLANISFNGGGKDSNKALYCTYGAAAGDGTKTTFIGCKFYGAENDGCYHQGNNATLISCESYSNGRYGININATGTRLIACQIYENDNTGLYGASPYGVMIGNLIYDNGKDGSGHGVDEFGVSTYTLWAYNSIYHNDDDGIEMNASSYDIIFVNNAFVGNGAYGIDFSTMGRGQIAYFGYNLGGANTSGHAYFGGEAVTDFANFANGNNVASSQTAEELFENVTTPPYDFTPETGSDLIGSGMPDAQGTATDIGAVEYEAGEVAAGGWWW